ncbi:MAG: stage III sporulation protein SpoIIIAB [Tissierella sp.]|uniref:stage III sporulation protein SpoIIIAB n=1 Tax=Tissierella sp. TaxID=41274 RepID=UPI003F9BAE9A
MNWLKSIFYFMVFFSSSTLGILYGGMFSKRERNLIDLEYNIRLLESEIIAGRTPLPEALENVYKKGKGEIKVIFQEIKIDLLENRREDIYISFSFQKNLLKKQYMFKDEDISIFLFLGKILGKSNKEDQESNLKFIIKQIQTMKEESRIEKEKNVKLYRTLGVLMGISIVIIMI